MEKSQRRKAISMHKSQHKVRSNINNHQKNRAKSKITIRTKKKEEKN